MTFGTAGETYDEEPYAGLTHQQTHPDLLATIGRLLGLAPAPIDSCRVLELGCGAGANILAMAEVLPGSEFLGVDYSERQVREGREAASELGLSNVTLHHADIRSLAPLDLGTFDFVIAHGVYSWVPADVRDALLATCKSVLNPHGIAYVSYNAYPGWFMMRGLREAMLYRTRDAVSLRDQAEQADAFVRLLRLAAPPSGDPFSQFLEVYGAHVEGRRRIGGDRAASLLLHDELAEVNDPFYFHEFAEHAAAHGLQYLADADFPSVFPGRLPAAVQAELRAIGRTVVEYQQYLDFLTNASFKQTLLCHDERALSRRLGDDLDVIRGLYAGSPARPEGKEDLARGVVRQFAGSDGARLAIDHPIGKAAMAILTERYPARVAFPQLLAEARARPGAPLTGDPAEEAQLAAVLLQGLSYSTSLVEMGTVAGAFTLSPGPRPRTPAFARRQASAGMATVTNLRHERITLDPVQVRLLALFDGTRTRDEALALVRREVDGGAMRQLSAFEKAFELLTETALFMA